MNKFLYLIIIVLVVEALVFGYQIYQRGKEPTYLMSVQKTYWDLLKEEPKEVILDSLAGYAKLLRPKWKIMALRFYDNKDYYNIMLTHEPDRVAPKEGKICFVVEPIKEDD